MDKDKLGLDSKGACKRRDYGLFLCNWGALVTHSKPPIIAGGARILLPEEIASRLRSGEELGPVMDEFTNKQ